MTVKTFLGTRPIHKPPQKILRDEDRSVTDGKYRFVFCILLTIWLASCIYALYCSARVQKTSLYNETIVENFTNHNYIDKSNETSSNIFVWIKNMFFYVDDYFDFDSYYEDRGSLFIWLGIIFYSALLLLAMKIMHCWSVMSPSALIVMSTTVLVTSIIYHIVRYFLNDELEFSYKKSLYWVVPEAVLLILSSLIFLNIMRHTGACTMGNLLKKAFTFYTTCRYLAIIGFLVSLVIILLNIFTAKVLKDFDVNSVGSKIIFSVIYAGSCYMILLIHIFGKMVISAAIASYYWNQNEEQSPFKVMYQKFIVISKYQFGSACCKATFTSLWFIALLGGIFKYQFEFYETAIGYCLIFEVLILIAFDYTVFLIGMYGVPASEATHLFSYFFRKPSQFIAYTCQGLFSSTFLILLPTNCIMLLLMWGLNENDQNFSFISSRSYLEILVLFLPVTFVLGTIEDARSICIMEDNDEKENSKNEKSVEEPRQIKIITDFYVDSRKNEKEQVFKSVSEQNNVN